MNESREFRPLNEHEKAVIRKAVDKGRLLLDNPLTSTGELLVSYESMQGGFCICLIRQQFSIGTCVKIHGNRFWRGASRRSYKDPRKPIKGEMLAFSRAVLYSRPVEV